MNDVQIGLLLTLITLSLCAAVLSCIRAASYRMVRALLPCLLLFAASFVPTTALLAGVSNPERFPLSVWTTLAGLMALLNIVMLAAQRRWIRRHVSQVSIKESCDQLPSALCFAQENGRVRLMNLKMDALSHQITGEALLNANDFWKQISASPVVELADDSAWSFERTALQVDGQRIFQITGTDVTEEALLNCQLETDNRRLAEVNLRLRRYGQNVAAAMRDREILRAKTHIHDELGRTLLSTRQHLCGGVGNTDDICAMWRQNLRLLRGDGAGEKAAGSLEQLLRAAHDIGVVVDIRGDFPCGNTEAAYLAEAAAHECLTNLVRHASGSRLEVFAAHAAGGWHIEYRNDGALPAGPIAEGGGLSSLRERVEGFGGEMTIAHAPRFLLTLHLPGPKEALI